MPARGDAIILIGFMGSGKSSVGRALAEKTKWSSFETDEMVTKTAGLSVSEIFSQFGEEKFREMETEALRNIPSQRAIVATGGGTVLRAGNVAMLHSLGTVAYLTAAEEILFGRIPETMTRPLLQTEDPQGTFTELLQLREPLYHSAADFVVDTSELSPEETADLILIKIDERAEV